MKRKGFTLIELLAVIVILAVIALITTIVIIKVVENARKNAAKNSALNYLDAVEKYVMYHDVDSEKYPYDLKDNTWNIVDTTTKEISLLNIIPSVKAEEVEVPSLNDFIKVKGSKPTSGTITVDAKGKITNAVMIVLNYNITCGSSTSCSVEGKDTDPTPVLSIGNVTSTKDSITIPYTVEIEKGSVTVECVYGTDENYGQIGTVNEENNTCTLSNLTSGTTYYFKLTPKSDKNKKGSSQTSSKTTASYIPATEFKVGDYVYMVPTSKSYTPSNTGTTPGSINPSELNTWVVIKNENDVVEMVSLYTSSTEISLYGGTGYNNAMTIFDELSNSYINSSFISSSRLLGRYSIGAYGTCNSDAGTCPGKETVDSNLIISALGSLKTTDVNLIEGEYWIAKTLYNNTPNYYHTVYWVDKDGAQSGGYLCVRGCNSQYVGTISKKVRPILTLKPDVKADSSGDGSEEHPWVVRRAWCITRWWKSTTHIWYR